MKKYLGLIISSILLSFANLAANSACGIVIYQPVESKSIKELSTLDN